jgi:uncharacterized cupredoxin-like copper-binding protein
VRVMLVMATAVLVGGAASASAAVQTPALIKTVNVSASEFRFVLSSKSAKRGIVIFKVKNVGKVSHDFSINGRKTKMISPGKSDTLRVTFLRKGTYPYKCTVPGHAAAGMKGVFKIT